jgi:DNA invertase Pin-like site-specific DNA recombinase
MSTRTTVRNASRVKSFEDLRGLRGECYVRDSTPDQKDGFGPDIQRHNEERFAQTYGIILGDRWYTEFVSGRNASKRYEFQQILEDARLDRFDVLLVDHTSRFGRNQAECIRYKEELQQLHKTVIFVSQGIISGSDKDFLSERINETLDEQYSRNLSRYVSEGLERKAEQGLHIGPVPLGYKSELLSGQPERKVQDQVTMPALLLILRQYATGKFSFREVADDLNAHGFKTQTGRAFTGYNIRDILSNRFYEGKIVYHKGLPDEKVFNGSHEVPAEAKVLWLACQSIRQGRAITKMGHPRIEKHDYPYSRVLKCQLCGNPYHGEAVYYRGKTTLRLTHERRLSGRKCKTWPRSRSVESLNQEFIDRVLAHIKLVDNWKSLVVTALNGEYELKVDEKQIEKLIKAKENLRKEHMWGHIEDDDYRRQWSDLENQLQAANPDIHSSALPNVERAAEFLDSLPTLWSHDGVTNKQRELLLQKVFEKIIIDGKGLVAIQPKSEYLPLFATIAMQNSIGYCEPNSPPSPPLII